MKICYISNTFFADTDLSVVAELAKQSKVCYGVVIPNKNNNFSIQQLKDVTKADQSTLLIKETVQRGRTRNPLNIITYFKWLKGLNVNQYDVVYISNTEDFFLSVLLYLFIKGRPVVYGVHDAVNHSGWKTNFLMKAAGRLLIRKSRSLLTFSNSQSVLLKAQITGKPVFTIPQSLKDFGKAKSAVERYSPVNFLFFGNISSYKGLDLLLGAVKQLKSEYKNFTLVIAGRCNDWETTYEKLIDDEMPVETKLGFIDNEEIPQLFSKAHYLLLPYRDVTQSGPLMIAYNYSLPVLASHLEGFAEFVEEGKTGYFFKPNDVADMKKVMEQALLRDEAEYKLLRENTRIAAQSRYGKEAIGNLYNNMLTETIFGYNSGQMA